MPSEKGTWSEFAEEEMFNNMPSEPKQKLLDAVIKQIRKDIKGGDETAIEELISTLPHDRLVGFLPDEQWIEHPKG